MRASRAWKTSERAVMDDTRLAPRALGIITIRTTTRSIMVITRPSMRMHIMLMWLRPSLLVQSLPRGLSVPALAAPTHMMEAATACSPGAVVTMENLDLGQDGQQNRPLPASNNHTKTPTQFRFIWSSVPYDRFHFSIFVSVLCFVIGKSTLSYAARSLIIFDSCRHFFPIFHDLSIFPYRCLTRICPHCPLCLSYRRILLTRCRLAWKGFQSGLRLIYIHSM